MPKLQPPFVPNGDHRYIALQTTGGPARAYGPGRLGTRWLTYQYLDMMGQPTGETGEMLRTKWLALPPGNPERDSYTYISKDDPTRIDVILRQLRRVWRIYPRHRFIQLLAVLASRAEGSIFDLWWRDDKWFYHALENFPRPDSEWQPKPIIQDHDPIDQLEGPELAERIAKICPEIHRSNTNLVDNFRLRQQMIAWLKPWYTLRVAWHSINVDEPGPHIMVVVDEPSRFRPHWYSATALDPTTDRITAECTVISRVFLKINQTMTEHPERLAEISEEWGKL